MNRDILISLGVGLTLTLTLGFALGSYWQQQQPGNPGCFEDEVYMIVDNVESSEWECYPLDDLIDHIEQR